ncbi:MAG: hypothetical protein KGM44_12335 [bacterium]|nr:hypothetical protein [bacterium]
MSAWLAALAAGVSVLILSFAQDAVPGLAFYHTWQYALALVVAIGLTVFYALRERRYRLAMVGVAVIGCAALYAGLTGADTETVARGPGQVVHAGGGTVVHFPIADAAQVRAGSARLALSGRGSLAPGGRSYTQSSVLIAQMRPAAYLDATDLRGRHLTITQPQGSAFLSPILLFPTRAKLRDRSYPIDLFALPALERTVQAFYFSPSDVAEVRRAELGDGEPALLVALTDARRNLVPGGIGFLPQGVLTRIDDVRLTASIGRYPVLVVAAAPWPPLLIGGAVLAVLGVIVRRRKEAVSPGRQERLSI